MKNDSHIQIMKRHLILLVCAATGLLISNRLHAQPFAIDWFTIDGGGGTSTGGVYIVNGTIGQPDAGVMTGGNYSLTGGFWGVAVAIQEEGAPLLTITHTGANVILTWPSPAINFGAEESPSLGTPAWGAIGNPIDDGTNVTVLLPSTPGDKFYRLKRTP